MIEFYGKNELDFASVVGPGYFNDPDEVSEFLSNFKWSVILKFLFKIWVKPSLVLSLDYRFLIDISMHFYIAWLMALNNNKIIKCEDC